MRRFASLFIKAMPESGGDSDMGKRISNIRGEPAPFRCARQPLPEEGTRMWGVLSVSIPPSFGRRCPQGGGWVTQGGVKDDVRLSIFSREIRINRC